MLILFLKALFATAVIEEFGALFFRERSLRLFLVVLLANILTNPTINLINWFLPNSLVESSFYSFAILFLELCVWGIEACLFLYLGKVRPLCRALIMSFLLNAASYFSGTLLSKIGYWN